MRLLGEFFGHIGKAVRSDPSQPERVVTRKEVEQETRQTDKGKLTLRRTTIEEIEISPTDQGEVDCGDPDRG